MKEKQKVNEHDFIKNMKSIIIRDLFPELKTAPDDETINRYNLTTYLQNYIGAEGGDFIDSIERDRELRRSAAPMRAPDPELESTQFKPWENPRFNSLFYQSKELENKSRAALTYDKKRQPRINYDMARFPDNYNNPTPLDYPMYHPFTTESSTTESESEFEGRSIYRNQLISQNPQMSTKQVRKDRLRNLKKRNELSTKGKNLLKSLAPLD
ncbi:hypothetical protein TRFO_37165 [Tritrichomonas foetus]|uniref:Uncharacterized protein n=1 Tax=Tritrichomonas foetus TaxID=1144522 RepID=A0A1J4JGP1_9EUKA|nr:hypothetical protein TRFO_37165 [Tritrichomonas foetus]|eukprot:OHS96621.1 hypothetical protein TRFO_37165 [Tritrichomonas foetus]